MKPVFVRPLKSLVSIKVIYKDCMSVCVGDTLRLQLLYIHLSCITGMTGATG